MLCAVRHQRRGLVALFGRFDLGDHLPVYKRGIGNRGYCEWVSFTSRRSDGTKLHVVKLLFVMLQPHNHPVEMPNLNIFVVQKLLGFGNDSRVVLAKEHGNFFKATVASDETSSCRYRCRQRRLNS